MTVPHSAANKPKDLVRQPASAAIWWGLPLLIGVSTNFLRLPLAGAAFIWAGAFAWMGIGCLLNARRCGRLHCFISGPVFLAGAVAAGLIGLGAISGKQALNDAAWITIAIALLAYVPEMVWGRYIPSREVK